MLLDRTCYAFLALVLVMRLTAMKGFLPGLLGNRFFSEKIAEGGVGGGVSGGNRFILIVVRFLFIEFLTPSLAAFAKRPKLIGFFDSYSLRIRALNSSSFRELSALLHIDAASLDYRFIFSPSVSRYTGDDAFI